MTTSFAANTELLSRCVAASIRPSFNKPNPTQSLECINYRFLLLSVSVEELGVTRNRKHSRIYCVEKSNSGGANSLTYKDAGVDIDAGSALVNRIAKMAPGIGGFGGLFPLGDSYLVTGTDGLGTKLKLAFETGIHDTIGIDLVAISVNDIVTSGAKPLFFQYLKN